MKDQLYVYFEDEFVGVLNGPEWGRSAGKSEVSFVKRTVDTAGTLRDAKESANFAEMNDVVWIPIRERHCIIDHLNFKDSDEIEHRRKHHHIPDYAEGREDRGKAIIYRWGVAAPSLDQYQMLFDLDEFEPA